MYFISYNYLIEAENRSMLWVLVVGIILVVVAVFLLMQNNAANNTVPTNNTETTNTTINNTDTEVPVDTNTNETVEMSFDLDEQNESGQNGTATLRAKGNQVEVAIALSNPNATSQPAHIHAGSCPTPGAVVFPLTPVLNGSSVTTLTTTLEDLIAQGDLAVNVHKSEEESSVYVSCANLDLQ